jgi:hypothetical protein
MSVESSLPRRRSSLDNPSEVKHPPVVSLSLSDFLQYEMSLKSDLPEHTSSPLKADVSRVFHFIHVAQHLSYLMGFGWLVCLDSFLFLITFLPIRLLISSCIKAYYIIATSYKAIEKFIIRKKGQEQHNGNLSKGFEISLRADFIRMTLMVLVILILDHFVHITQHYHWIRTQSTFKLYVIFNILQVLDRLGCFFGEDLFTALFGNLLNSYSSSSEKENAMDNRSNIRKLFSSLLHDYSLSWIVALIYVSLHSYVLTIHIIALSVAINSNDTSLVVLLVSSNFVEIKGSAFKRYSQENLFQLVAAGKLFILKFNCF